MGDFSRFSRRTVLGGLAATAGAAVLAGCGGTDAGPGGGSPDSGQLNVWGGVPAESGPDDLIAAFQKEHPGITVTYTRYVNDDSGNLKLDNSLQGGVPIDLFFSYGAGRISKRVNAGLTLDITDKVKETPELAPFAADASPQANYVFDGKIHTVPAALSPGFVLANADLLDDAGIEVPEDWDVNDYHEIATKLSRGNTHGSFVAPEYARMVLGPDMYYAEGGEASRIEDPAFRTGLELSLAMQNDNSTMPKQEILAQKLETFSQSAFLSGRFAMMATQAYMLRYVADTKEYPHDFTVRAFPLPAPIKGQEHWNAGAYGDLLSISQKSQQQDAAWTFFTFWLANAGTYMVKGGRLPSVVDPAKTDDILDSLLGEEKETLYDVDSFKPVLFDDTVKVPVDTIYTGATEIEQIVKKSTDQVLLGDMTVDQWVTDVKKQADAAIKKG
ncbi:MAG: extracellular solute-binding protein [Propionibacteriales bacterium]|nr:extracellular solute-binding protein [Propionibacteriales bacterium]